MAQLEARAAPGRPEAREPRRAVVDVALRRRRRRRRLDAARRSVVLHDRARLARRARRPGAEEERSRDGLADRDVQRRRTAVGCTSQNDGVVVTRVAYVLPAQQ